MADNDKFCIVHKFDEHYEVLTDIKFGMENDISDFNLCATLTGLELIDDTFISDDVIEEALLFDELSKAMVFVTALLFCGVDGKDLKIVRLDD